MFKRLLPAGSLAFLMVALLAWLYGQSPRTWSVSEVPIAFWAWQNEAPSESDVGRSVSEIGARIIFLRAGQIDFEDGELRRIREVKGVLPRRIEIHLLYNATRSFLSEFERLKPAEIASTILSAYREDTARAESDRAQVAGLQLDIDSPTRLLPHYAQVLQELRSKLPDGVKLSITGLPTWMNSPALKDTLKQVDFWVPQFYGARIPDRMDASIPIASSEDVAREVEKARSLDRPFYAGLAAYGYAILYARSGLLLDLRGDLDPAIVANDSNFELIERRPFSASQNGKDADSALVTSEWRYVYRAMRETVVDGLPVRAGEYLMLDMPSASSLRENARIIRERAGDRLLGLCIFRLPASGDPTTLTVREIAAALSDRDPMFIVDAQAEVRRESDHRYHLSLKITNKAAVRSRMGEGAMSVALRVPTGSLRAVNLYGLASYEPLCAMSGESDGEGFDKARPCGLRRANRLRFMARTWDPRASAQAVIEMSEKPLAILNIEIFVMADDGRELKIEKTLKAGRELSDEM